MPWSRWWCNVYAQGLADGTVDLLAVNYAEGAVSPYNVSRYYDYDPHPCVLYGSGKSTLVSSRCPVQNTGSVSARLCARVIVAQ